MEPSTNGRIRPTRMCQVCQEKWVQIDNLCRACGRETGVLDMPSIAPDDVRERILKLLAIGPRKGHRLAYLVGITPFEVKRIMVVLREEGRVKQLTSARWALSDYEFVKRDRVLEERRIVERLEAKEVAARVYTLSEETALPITTTVINGVEYEVKNAGRLESVVAASGLGSTLSAVGFHMPVGW